MIASERTQNIIVVSVILITVVSSGFLVSNAAYYGGSYSLAGRLDVSLLEIRVSNLDHSNESIYPGLRLTFNLATDSLTEGNVRITFMGAEVTLNNDSLSYTTFSFTPQVVDQYLYPEFNRNYTMHNSASTSFDRETILLADSEDSWNWDIEFRYSFIVFDERGTITWRWFYFETTITTII